MEVADAAGVSPAARRLGLSKSIVSRRLARLEEDLGVQLLSRTTRGAALTDAGRTFRDHAAKILSELEAARDGLRPDGDLRGHFRVALPISLGPALFSPVLARMARLHPRLDIHTAYSDRFVDLVAEGFDCAIRVGYLEDSSLVARRFGPVHGSLVASPAYIERHGSPEAPDELLEHQALMQGTESWQFMDGDRTISITPQGRFKADNGVALAAAAAAGLGIAYVPDCVTHPYVTSGALVVVMKRYPPPPAAAYVVRPPGQLASRAVRVLTDLMLAYVEETPDLWGSGD